jgi:hypothetical protein
MVQCLNSVKALISFEREIKETQELEQRLAELERSRGIA